MKKILYIIGMAVATMFASCQKDASIETMPTDAVAFSAESITPLTRVSGTSWEKGDAIGITMAMAGAGEVVLNDNIKYLASDDGTPVSFTPDDDIIYYPQDGSAVSFVAFYPYQEGWVYSIDGMIFDLSGQDGTAEGQEKSDLLWSIVENKVDGDNVGFQFTHMLSKVQITVSNYDAMSAFDNLSELSATLNTKYTHYSAFMGRVDSDQTRGLKMLEVSNDGSTAVFSAIITPGAVSDEIIFTDGTAYYSAALAITNAEAGTQYNFTATVGDQGYSIVELESDGVTDWTTQGDTAMSKEIELVDGVYQIYTAKGMKMFADLVNGGSYSLKGKLMNNINLEGSADNQWTPMGDYDYQKGYTGTFDGGGFEVSGLYIDYKNGAGLFSITSGATIENLSISGSVSGMSDSAGIVGSAWHTTFTNCHSSATVTGESSKIGGIAGSGEYSTFENCSNSGEVSGANYIGGIVGSVTDSTVINCYNSGSVEGSGSVGWSVYNIGGVVGKNFTTSIVINCYNSGSVTGSGNNIGGVVGENHGGQMSNCYNAGAVSTTGSTTYIGGVVGYSHDLVSHIADISDCYFDSTIYTGNAIGVIESTGTVTNTLGYSTTYMQGGEFVKLLNNGAYTYNQTSPEIKAYGWKAVASDYPIFDTENEPTYTDDIDNGDND